VLALLVVLSACRGSAEQNATSQLFVYNNVTGALLASSGSRGAITLNTTGPTATRQLRVMRQVTDPNNGTTTTNITTTVDYNTSDPAVVTVGGNDTSFAGKVTATGPGTAVIDIVYHDPGDPTTDDTASIDVNVVP